MTKKAILLFPLLMLLLPLIFATYSTKFTTANDEINIHVDCNYLGEIEDGTPEHPFKTITAAVARAGVFVVDKVVNIKVRSGRYTEEEKDITINRPLNLIGEDARHTIIDPPKDAKVRHIFNIVGAETWLQTEWGCNVSGFTIDQAPMDPNVGIRVVNVKNPTYIYGNKIRNNHRAIRLTECSNVNIFDNTFSNNLYGIEIQQDTTNCLIRNNTIYGQWGAGPASDGINLDQTQDCMIMENKIENNYHGIKMSNVRNITISANIIQNLPDIPTPALAGIYSFSSDLNIVGNNTLQRCSSGIRFVDCENNTILNNEILYCTPNSGIYFDTSQSGGIIKGNFLYENTNGIQLVDVNHTSIEENIILECVYGVRIGSKAFGNLIYRNNFLNNLEQAMVLTGSQNSWDNGEEGNYWCDHESEDLNDDGFSDDSYILNEYNQDNYPRIVPRGPIPIFWDEERYGCLVESRKLTISGFHLDQETKHIHFNTIGYGDCNLTVPRNLFGGTLCVLINNTLWPCIVTWADTTISMHFKYETHIPHEVEVIASGFEWMNWKDIRENPEIQNEIADCPDLNGDGVVNIIDISIVAAKYES